MDYAMTDADQNWRENLMALADVIDERNRLRNTIATLYSVMRNCHCPSDGRRSVDWCVREGLCGCSCGLLLEEDRVSETGRDQT
jgi:hypothetical protein